MVCNMYGENRVSRVPHRFQVLFTLLFSVICYSAWTQHGTIQMTDSKSIWAREVPSTRGSVRWPMAEQRDHLDVHHHLCTMTWVPALRVHFADASAREVIFTRVAYFFGNPLVIKLNALCFHFVKEVRYSITLQHDQLLMFFELFSFNVSFLSSSPQIGGSQGLFEGKFVQARKKARRE
jgi:hypothetical protein